MPWEILKHGLADLTSEVLAIHAAMLPTNQILLFGGNEFNVALHPADRRQLTTVQPSELAGPRRLRRRPSGTGCTSLAGLRATDGVFAALTVDRFGRMNITWLDVNVWGRPSDRKPNRWTEPRDLRSLRPAERCRCNFHPPLRAVSRGPLRTPSANGSRRRIRLRDPVADPPIGCRTQGHARSGCERFSWWIPSRSMSTASTPSRSPGRTAT
jgi:hypothetical protein